MTFFGDKPAISLQKIFIVTSSRFEFLRFFLEAGVPKAELMINGQPKVTAAMGVMPMKFLIRVLEALGHQRRVELKEAGAESGRAASPALIAAAAICANRQPHEIEAILQTAGVEPENASAMVASMREIYERKDRMTGLIMLVVGLLLIAVPFVVAMAMREAGASFILVLSGVAVVGLLVVLAGVFKAVTGRKGINESTLAESWRESQSALSS